MVDISEFARIADANTLSIGPDGTKGSHADDEIVVVLEDVTNPSPGSNDVNITTNPQSVNSQATTRYTVESDSTPPPQGTTAGEVEVGEGSLLPVRVAVGEEFNDAAADIAGRASDSDL